MPFITTTNYDVILHQDYQFGYAVEGYDDYGLPNHHARQEQREGNTVKGQYTVRMYGMEIYSQ